MMGDPLPGWRLRFCCVKMGTLLTGMECGVLLSNGWGILQMGMKGEVLVPDGWGTLQVGMDWGFWCLRGTQVGRVK